MEVEASDEMSARFWLEGCQRRVAELGVGLPVLAIDGVEQALAEAQQFVSVILHRGRSRGRCQREGEPSAEPGNSSRLAGTSPFGFGNDILSLPRPRNSIASQLTQEVAKPAV